MDQFANAVGNLVKKVASLKGESAAEFKAKVEAHIAKLESDAVELHGKEHQKERAAIGKEVARLKADARFVDACRVVKGHAPAHGHFADEVGAEPSSAPTAEEAEKLAVEAEQALAELTPAPPVDIKPSDDASQRRAWKERIATLEEKVASESGHQNMTRIPAVVHQDIEELEAVAQEIVDYRERLRKTSGYTNKALKEDVELAQIEERLDRLSESLLRPARLNSLEHEKEVAASTPSTKLVVAQLADRERRLAVRMARHREASLGLSPSQSKEVERLLVQLAEKKAALKAEGLTEHEQDKDEEVLKWLIRLQELRGRELHDKKRTKNMNKDMEADLDELEKLHEDLQILKRELRNERHCSNKGLKHDPAVLELEERLHVLKKFGCAGGA
mmetsp:Transcript_46205/g.86213  ORF Transcript_46205/g.86213 Transcript_46205/m.86213 type:complete len:390 (-) Transcript_46205:98-1267(-)